VSLSWYIVHAYSNFEHRVKSGLEERIERMGLQDKFGEILIPTEEVVEMKEGQKRRSERKFFPGYVLVQMEMDDETWHLVKEVPNWIASRKASTSHGRRCCLSRVRLFASLTDHLTTSVESLKQ